MTLALVSKDTSLLSAIVPNSSIAARLGFSILLISWWQSPFELVFGTSGGVSRNGKPAFINETHLRCVVRWWGG